MSAGAVAYVGQLLGIRTFASRFRIVLYMSRYTRLVVGGSEPQHGQGNG